MKSSQTVSQINYSENIPFFLTLGVQKVYSKDNVIYLHVAKYTLDIDSLTVLEIKLSRTGRT